MNERAISLLPPQQHPTSHASAGSSLVPRTHRALLSLVHGAPLAQHRYRRRGQRTSAAANQTLGGLASAFADTLLETHRLGQAVPWRIARGECNSICSQLVHRAPPALPARRVPINNCLVSGRDVIPCAMPDRATDARVEPQTAPHECLGSSSSGSPRPEQSIGARYRFCSLSWFPLSPGRCAVVAAGLSMLQCVRSGHYIFGLATSTTNVILLRRLLLLLQLCNGQNRKRRKPRCVMLTQRLLEQLT